ncbi:hypothetical protein [Maritalea sp.]|uniref:hypothetical protein n=1 Tax=Maritalea sp. TaxID=2003361 RepID=UPI003F4AD613
MTTGAMIEVSSEMMAVANEDKIGTAAAYQIGPVNIVNTLVTERGTDQSHLKAISNSGISIELV